MSVLVVMGASCSCSFGTAPSSLVVPPANKILGCGKPAGTIFDNKPMTNVLPFGMCNTLSNPQVASATAAALGVLTPMPCVPMINAPWMPGCKNVLIANKPALGNDCKCICNWGGQIQITNPGQNKIMLP